MSSVAPGYLNKNRVALVILESVIIVLSMAVIIETSYYLLKHYRQFLIITKDNVYVAILFLFLVQLISLALGLYSKDLRENFKGIYQRIFISFLLATLGTIWFFGIAVDNLIGMLPICLSAVVTFFIICSLRYQLLHLTVCHSIKRKILVLGAGKRAAVIEERTRREADRRQFTIHAYVKSTGDDNDMIQRDCVIELDQALGDYVSAHAIDQIVIACDERRNNLPFAELTSCKLKGVSVVDVLSFVEDETGQ
ncbi:MAG: hypothetical protein HRU22_09970, partial [Gammaproteobacteria bacterium]|nr:hypothetical protein [Gammaproteobacteria bacterium]